MNKISYVDIRNIFNNDDSDKNHFVDNCHYNDDAALVIAKKISKDLLDDITEY